MYSLRIDDGNGLLRKGGILIDFRECARMCVSKVIDTLEEVRSS
jgi:hypothetical protein